MLAVGAISTVSLNIGYSASIYAETVPEESAPEESVPEESVPEEPAPPPSPCDSLVSMYTSSGGSLSPEALRGQGGLGADVASCLGIDLSVSAPPPSQVPDQRPSCETVIGLVHSSQGSSPSVEWLASQGGLGADYARCMGIDLSKNTSQDSQSPTNLDPATPTDNSQESTPVESQVILTESNSAIYTRPGVTVQRTVFDAPKPQITLSSTMKPGKSISVSIKRFDSKSKKLQTISTQKTNVTKRGEVKVKLNKSVKKGDVVTFLDKGKRVAVLKVN